MSTDSPTLTTVHLVGSLGKAMGREVWHLDVSSVAEAVRAISINTKGKLDEYLSGPARNRFYRIALQKKTNVIDPEEATHRSGRSTIYIMPTIRGRKSGLGKIAAGIAILALAYFTGGLSLAVGGSGWAGAVTATGIKLSFLGTMAVGFGTSLILGGITQLLTPTAKGPSEQDTKGSTIFQGNAASVVQGGSMPLIYGRTLASPVLVAMTVDNYDTSTTSAGSSGSVNQTDLEGGGIQYEYEN